MRASPATLVGIGAGGPARDSIDLKVGRLRELLGGLGRTLVAYSGGVDSSYLLFEAHRVLGPGVLGVVADSPSLPRSELRAALDLARGLGIGVRVVPTRELDREGYRANGADRCYHCKEELFERLGGLARAEGWETLAYGAVTDDRADLRPGMRAAERCRVRAPLLEAGLAKLEVRLLARRAGLPVWDKPQSACLASRIPHGSEVSPEKLAQVERAEEWIRTNMGVRVLRVRHEGSTARIEVDPADIGRLSEPSHFEAISFALSVLGFTKARIDPEGYRRKDPLPVAAKEG